MSLWEHVTFACGKATDFGRTKNDFDTFYIPFRKLREMSYVGLLTFGEKGIRPADSGLVKK